MRKKWLALLLSLCMVLSLFPAAVFAAEGDGTAASPYLVSNEEELRQAVEQGGYIQLTDNIVISQAIEIKKDLVIDGKNPDSGSANGENCYTVSTNVADRVFNVNQAKDLSLVFQNLQILSESEKAYTRGISLYQSENIQVELENVKLTAGYYALILLQKTRGLPLNLIIPCWRAGVRFSFGPPAKSL